jgi:hypothetical protein
LEIGQQIVLRSTDNDKLRPTLIPMPELPSVLTSRTLLFDRRVLDNAVKDGFGVDPTDRASFLATKVDRAEDMDQVIAEIDENFHNSDAETETTEESDALASVLTGIGDIKTIMYGLCVVVLVTVLPTAVNSMAMMVRDRVTEVAVMRALGFWPHSRRYARTGRCGRGGWSSPVDSPWHLTRHAQRSNRIHGGNSRHSRIGCPH